jgi:SAM-dependent methyltransferase
LPFADSCADLVTNFDVIQHIQFPDLMICEAVRILKPGGYLMMTFPFLYAECDFHDYHRWTMEGMAALLKSKGLGLVLFRRRGGLFFAVACALNWFVQHLIPGQRQSWRAQRGLLGISRAVLVNLVVAPTQLISWIALCVDAILPSRGFYMGGALLAQKPTSPHLR